MEYKKSAPAHGKLNGRYATFYEYEFPRATRKRGPFLPAGTLRVREFLYSDGEHDQLIQFICLSKQDLATKNEQRVLVDKMLDIKREDKKFTEGKLTSKEISGEIREYSGRKMVSIGRLLAEKEKIGLFGAARLIRDKRRRQQRIKRWKTRFSCLAAVVLFVAGVGSGAFLQQNDLFDLDENPFYQNYVVTSLQMADDFIQRLIR